METRLTELCIDLVSRGYRSILDSFGRVRKVSWAEAIMRVHRDRETYQKVRFIFKYDPRLPDIRSTILRSWKVITEDKEMKRVFPNPTMVCYQKVKSLGEMLVRAKLPTRGNSGRGRRGQGESFHPGRQSNCPMCDYLREKKVVTSIVFRHGRGG